MDQWVPNKVSKLISIYQEESYQLTRGLTDDRIKFALS